MSIAGPVRHRPGTIDQCAGDAVNSGAASPTGGIATYSACPPNPPSSAAPRSRTVWARGSAPSGRRPGSRCGRSRGGSASRPALPSQLERGLAQPSVATLWAIVTELSLSLDALFADPPGAEFTDRPVQVQRAGTRTAIEFGGTAGPGLPSGHVQCH
jgi:hypothetical protein